MPIRGDNSYFPMPEGRVLFTSPNIYTQEFIMTDQQGNARVAFRNSGGTPNIAKVYQENSYYGTGLILPNSPVSTPTVANKKLYNGGSEWQNDSASGTYNLPDYYETDNRNYDAAIGRFIGVDPEAESAESMTSYQYGGDNPIVNNDPDGARAGIPQYQNPNVNEFNQSSATNLSSFYGDVAGVTGGPLNNGMGLYFNDPEAYWSLYAGTNGTFYGKSVFHAGDGTVNDPRTGSLAQGLSDLRGAGAEIDVNGSPIVGGLATYTYQNGTIAVEPNGTFNTNYDQYQGANNTWYYYPNQGSDIIVIYGGGGIRSTQEATYIYYHGNGSPQALAGNVIQDLVRSATFQSKNNRIISGKTTSMSGSFSVDLTSVDFFVGHTNVDYSIKIIGNNAIVTYTMFVNDGYWDPNFVLENTLGRAGVKSMQPDGMGPNLEAPGGHPYPFIPVTGTETFPNPGYR